MSRPEPSTRPPTPPPVRPDPPRYGRYVAIPALAVLLLITLNTLLTKPNGVTGVAPGQRLPPFATPLVLGALEGDPDIAKHDHEGSNGEVAACRLRRAGVLNVCQLYERGPLVLALFIDSGSCPDVVSDLQRLMPAFPGVRFAAVALNGRRGPLRRLIAERRLTLPVGFDRGGTLLALYKVATCPQVTFVLPGGVARGKALLRRPSSAALRRRVEDLVAAARARGWRSGRGSPTHPSLAHPSGAPGDS
jgi:hypothetical protein